MRTIDFDALPGGDLVRAGLADLAAGRRTAEALLVSLAEPRLRDHGIDVPTPIVDADLELYLLLAEEHGDAAHSTYNALRRSVTSFERALACVR